MSWLRRNGWKLVVHGILATLGLLNIYPFMWMLSTSFKEKTEATAEKYDLVPGLKYQVAVGVTAVPEGLGERQARRLTILIADTARQHQESRTFIPPRIAARDYARQESMVVDGKEGRSYDTDTAVHELDGLVQAGLLERVRLQSENYTYVWRDLRFALHTAVSLVVTAAVVVLTVLASTMLGYALARLSMPGKFFIICLLLAGSVAPQDATFVPIFMMFQSLNLFDGLWGMTLWMVGAGIGNVFLCAGYFMTLPKEVEEAAKVDGAGPFRIFFSVALPMAQPIVMTVGLFAFLGSWNNFLIPLLCTLSRPELQPLATAVYTFRTGYPEAWHLTNAAAAIMVVPVIVIFVFLQKKIVDSIAVGAVKG